MLAAIATGQDINAPDDMDAIRDKLRALKLQIRTFWSSENEWNQFMSANEFDMATYWSRSASRSRNQFKLPVEFVIPTEGAIDWLAVRTRWDRYLSKNSVLHYAPVTFRRIEPSKSDGQH